MFYTHVPKAKLSKLDKKANISIVIGYSSISKGYKVFDLSKKQFVVYHDVIVNESAYWNDHEVQSRTYIQSRTPSQQQSDDDVAIKDYNDDLANEHRIGK